jgi:hypothetical protein
MPLTGEVAILTRTPHTSQISIAAANFDAGSAEFVFVDVEDELETEDLTVHTTFTADTVAADHVVTNTISVTGNGDFDSLHVLNDADIGSGSGGGDLTCLNTVRVPTLASPAGPFDFGTNTHFIGGASITGNLTVNGVTTITGQLDVISPTTFNAAVYADTLVATSSIVCTDTLLAKDEYRTKVSRGYVNNLAWFPLDRNVGNGVRIQLTEYEFWSDPDFAIISGDAVNFAEVGRYRLHFAGPHFIVNYPDDILGPLPTAGWIELRLLKEPGATEHIILSRRELFGFPWDASGFYDFDTEFFVSPGRLGAWKLSITNNSNGRVKFNLRGAAHSPIYLDPKVIDFTVQRVR